MCDGSACGWVDACHEVFGDFFGEGEGLFAEGDFDFVDEGGGRGFVEEEGGGCGAGCRGGGHDVPVLWLRFPALREFATGAVRVMLVVEVLYL